MKLRPLDVRFYVPDTARMIAAVRPFPESWPNATTEAMAESAARSLPGWGCYVFGEQRSHKWRAGGMLMPNHVIKYWKEVS